MKSFRPYLGTPLYLGTLLAMTLTAGVAGAADGDYLPARALQDAGLMKYWQLQLPLDRGQVVRDVYLVDEALYVATQDGYVYALDAYTGVLRWLQPVTRSGYKVRRPTHLGDLVVFVTPVDIQTYDRRSGDGQSRHDLRYPPGSAIVTDGQRLFVGGLDRRLYSLELPHLFYAWRVVTNGPITSSPAVHGENVYVATEAGGVYACTRADKRLVWQTSVFGPVSADLVVTEDGVYVASRDQSLYLLFLETGEIRWRARFSGRLLEPPVVTPAVVFQYCEDDGLVAVENRVVGVEERLRWRLREGRQALTVHEGTVYVLSRDAELLAVREVNGEVAVRIPAPGFTLGAPAVATSTVFLASPDGQLFCARPRNLPPLKPEDIVNALRPAAEPATRPPPDSAPRTAGPALPGDPLRSDRRGAAIGGRSRISRGFGSGGESE